MLKKISVILLFIPFLSAFWLFKSEPALSVWQGYTASNQASFNILVSKDETLSYFLNNQEPLHPELKREFSSVSLYHLKLENLNPQTTYQLTIKDENLKTVSEKTFKTLNLNQREFTFAVASCMDDKWKKQHIWKELLSFQPDMIFLIGDVVYADKYILEVSFNNLSKRYLETIQTLPLYKTSKLTPILAIWDDHDYGMNNGHGNFKYKKEITKLFRDFFPLPTKHPHLSTGPGISFLLKAKNQNFLFTDSRSFQSPPQSQTPSLWGKEQENWILKNLSKNPTWIISGGQILGRHHRFESFEAGFPDSFKAMMNRIMKAQSPVFFLSGDRHLSELLKIDPVKETWAKYNTYELTTSPIHAKTYPQKPDFALDPRHIHHVPNKLNYAIIKSRVTPDTAWHIQLAVYGLSKQTLFSENLTITK